MMAREVSRMYREFSEIPVYTAAYYLQSNSAFSTIRVTTSVRDHLRNIKRAVNKHIISTPSDVIVTSSQDTSDALASIPSPSGKKLGILREIADGSAKKRFVEVWVGDRLEATKEVTKIHDDFHLNPAFFSLSFSKSESSFIYTAEAKAPEVDENSSEDTARKFRFIPDFGERLIGKKRPGLYLFRWTPRKYHDESEAAEPSTPDGESQGPATVSPLKPSLPEDSTVVFGQAVYAPDQIIFATGYEQTPEGRKLGVVGCWNHPSSIFKLELPKELPDASEAIPVDAQRLTSPEFSTRSPRVTDAPPDKPYITVWLANPIRGPHASVTSLHALRSNEDNSTVVVDYVWEPSCKGGFPGLYLEQLPLRPFLSLNSSSETVSHLVTHSIWGSRQTVLGISLSSGEVHDFTPGEKQAWTVAGTDGRKSVLVTRSAIHSPNELLEGKLQSVNAPLSWKVIDKPQLTVSARKSLHSLETSIRPLPNRFPTEMITIQPNGTKSLPLLTYPHGGPHGTFISEFNASNVALALEGYIVSLVNYTGSLGFGQKYVEALMGRAGELDVKDCYESVKHLVKLGIAQEGPGKQFVQGGSHGGFLSAHLIGQYPEFFSATVMRNPVIATGEIASVSDIPDWAFAEFGTPFGPRTTITSDVFEKLQKASPIAHVDAVKAPVLLLTGEIDKRVPPSQSKNYYYALKGRGKEVELLMFPGNGHPLDSVEAELIGWEASRDWFAKFAKR